jgi:dTDP-4-dehydrorhamnose 3,5-epimerase
MAFDFDVEQCTLPGVVIFSPVAFNDERGMIWTSFDETLRQMLDGVSPGLGGRFAHDKFVRSSKSVLRGIHGDEFTWKLVSGFGNAFLVLSGEAVYHYKLAYEGDYRDAGEQFTFAWDDHLFNIEWMTDSPILSERDRNASN